MVDVLLTMRQSLPTLTTFSFLPKPPYRQIFDSDDYNPIQVCTDDQYHGVLEVFPYQNLHLAHAPFPKNFPFSGMVPQVFRQLKLFVLNCTFYADKLNLRWALIGIFYSTANENKEFIYGCYGVMTS